MAASHNPTALSSEISAENSASPVGNSRSLAIHLANDLARQIGMTRTWPNLQTIRLAIEGEASFSGVTLISAKEIIAAAAGEFSVAPPDQPYYQRARITRTNVIDRFWFEDSLWRWKDCYNRWLAKVEESRCLVELKTVPTPQPIRPAGSHEGSPWQKLLAVLEKRINRHSFDTWLRPTRYHHEANGTLFICAPTPEFRYGCDKYADLIQQAIDELELHFTDVRFISLEASSS